MVLDVVKAFLNNRFPAEAASNTQNSTTDPQLAVGAGKEITLLLLVVPPVPELATVEPADCVPAQLAIELVTATRA